MKQKLFLKILFGTIAFVLLLMFMTTAVIEPFVRKKLQNAFNQNSADYLLKIDKVHISILKSGIVLKDITMFSRQEHSGQPDLKGEIISVSLKGINLVKALFKKEIDIREVNIFNSHIIGMIPFPKKTGPPKISSLNIRIDNLILNKLVLEIKNTTTAQSYSVKDGSLKLYDLHVMKQDTLSCGIFKQLDFNAQELITVSPDSMYTIKAIGTNYSVASKTLTVDSFSIQPNYTEYEFTARHQFETDRFEAGFSQISFHNFSAANYIKSGNLVGSFIEIGEMELKAFRDKRKEFRHVNKPTFQEMIYTYPGKLQIDSLGILDGNITYTEHAEKANEPGIISFNKFNARIYRITNDTIYKTEKAYIGLEAEALLMGKAKMTVALKGRLFDSQNTFAVNGKLSEMEIMDMNPILEKNAFLFATSGKINAMNFSFTANNTKATGNVKLLYHGLNIAIKNKRTDETTAIKEQITSVIANMKVLDSNPMPGEEVRTGIIDQERDPEKFLFNYCFKSILSGMKTSIIQSPKEKKK